MMKYSFFLLMVALLGAQPCVAQLSGQWTCTWSYPAYLTTVSSFVVSANEETVQLPGTVLPNSTAPFLLTSSIAQGPGFIVGAAISNNPEQYSVIGAFSLLVGPSSSRADDDTSVLYAGLGLGLGFANCNRTVSSNEWRKMKRNFSLFGKLQQSMPTTMVGTPPLQVGTFQNVAGTTWITVSVENSNFGISLYFKDVLRNVTCFLEGSCAPVPNNVPSTPSTSISVFVSPFSGLGPMENNVFVFPTDAAGTPGFAVQYGWTSSDVYLGTKASVEQPSCISAEFDCTPPTYVNTTGTQQCGAWVIWRPLNLDYSRSKNPEQKAAEIRKIYSGVGTKDSPCKLGNPIHQAFGYDTNWQGNNTPASFSQNHGYFACGDDGTGLCKMDVDCFLPVTESKGSEKLNGLTSPCLGRLCQERGVELTKYQPVLNDDGLSCMFPSEGNKTCWFLDPVQGEALNCEVLAAAEQTVQTGGNWNQCTSPLAPHYDLLLHNCRHYIEIVLGIYCQNPKTMNTKPCQC